MFCKNCGSEILDGYKFCMNCGTPVEALKKPEPAEESTIEPAIIENSEISDEEFLQRIAGRLVHLYEIYGTVIVIRDIRVREGIAQFFFVPGPGVRDKAIRRHELDITLLFKVNATLTQTNGGYLVSVPLELLKYYQLI